MTGVPCPKCPYMLCGSICTKCGYMVPLTRWENFKYGLLNRVFPPRLCWDRDAYIHCYDLEYWSDLWWCLVAGPVFRAIYWLGLWYNKGGDIWTAGRWAWNGPERSPQEQRDFENLRTKHYVGWIGFWKFVTWRK
jgi:hypothetical protein